MDEAMPVLGEIVDVTYQGNTYALTWYVVQGNVHPCWEGAGFVQ